WSASLPARRPTRNRQASPATRIRPSERAAPAQADLPLINGPCVLIGRCPGSKRAEEREQIVQVAIAQAIGTKIGHQRFLVADDFAQVRLQVSLQAFVGVHDLNGEGVFTFAGTPNLLAVACDQGDRLIPACERAARVANGS